MITQQLEFFDGDRHYQATAEIEGITASWVAKMSIPEPLDTNQLNISYRLGEWLNTLFSDQHRLDYYSPLIDLIEMVALKNLPQEGNPQKWNDGQDLHLVSQKGFIVSFNKSGISSLNHLGVMTETSISKSKQLDSAIPASKISSLSSANLDMVADDWDCGIELKEFHAHDSMKLAPNKTGH